MNCFSCSRNTLSLFIRSIHPEYRQSLIRTCPPFVPPMHRGFSVARLLRNDTSVSEDLQTQSRHSEAAETSEISVSQQSRTKHTKEASPTETEERPRIKREQWQIQKAALKEKFGDQPWQPRKKLSPDAMEGIRHLHMSQPEKFTTPLLAEYFKVSPEAIRRILKSKWRPSDEEEDDRLRRWDKRGERIWSNLVEMGVKPPKKWREMGVGRARPGEVPKWKSRWRNRVPVNDSLKDDIIPFVNQVSEESTSRWQRTPIANRML